MTFENLGTRTVPLFLAALLTACAGGGDDTDDTDETDDTTVETAETGETGGGSGPLLPTQYSYFAQLGIDADGKLADFGVQGNSYRSGLFITFEDDDENSCGFGYFFTPPEVVDTDETDAPPTLVAEGDAELLAWLDEQGLIDGVTIKDGTYEATELEDDQGNPCELHPDFAALATAPDEIFLSDVNGDPSSMFVGVGDTLSESLEEVLDNAIDSGQLTEADKALYASSYVRLPTTYQLVQDGPELDALEMTTTAIELDEDMEAVIDGQEFSYLDAADFGHAGGLAKGAYLLSGRVLFGL